MRAALLALALQGCVHAPPSPVITLDVPPMQPQRNDPGFGEAWTVEGTLRASTAAGHRQIVGPEGEVLATVPEVLSTAVPEETSVRLDYRGGAPAWGAPQHQTQILATSDGELLFVSASDSL